MASVGEVIYEDYLYKLTGRSRSILWSKNNPWKQRYFQLKRLGNKPVLEYYAKKPKTKHITPRGKIDLWPSFRVEKVMNMKNRAYVFQLTTSDFSWCLSADEQRIMDVFVFFLQIQSRLKDQIKDDFIVVQPENSEAMRRIGAKETNSILHVSPYGVTLALQSNRAVLAQWPLKSIRFYESSGQGQICLEAGRVAPMGDGNYVFNTAPGEDNTMYDLLDQYVLDAIGRAQPDRRGNRQEVEDYVREAENLLALTVVTACTPNNPDIPNTVQNNWNTDVSTPGTRPRQIVHTRLTTTGSLASLNSQNSVTSPSHGGPLSFDSNSSRNSPQVNHGQRPLPPVRNSPAPGSRRGSEQTINLADRPPMPPPSSSIPIKPQGPRSKQDDGYLRMNSTASLKSPSSNSPFTPSSADWMPPPTFKDVMRQGSRSPISENGPYIQDSYLQPISIALTTSTPKRVDNHRGNEQLGENDAYLTPSSSVQSEFSGAKGQGQVVPQGRTRRLRSASCEDLSDYLRSVRYDPMSKSTGDLLEDGNDDDVLPEPFPRLQTFSGSLEWQGPGQESYYNIDGLKGKIYDGPSLPFQELRKRFTKRKQQTLRRSVSNPNFVGSLSKEKIHSVRVSVGMEPSFRHQNRSLLNLIPDNLKKRLSKDSSRTGASSGGQSPHSSKANSGANSPYNSLGRKSAKKEDVVASTSVKGINVTRRSRSFRKPKTNGEEHSTNVTETESSEISGANSAPSNKQEVDSQISGQGATDIELPPRKGPKLAPKPAAKPVVKQKPIQQNTEQRNRVSVDVQNKSASATTEV